MTHISLNQWLVKVQQGAFESTNVHTQIEAGWMDWFCKNEKLSSRLNKLIPKVQEISSSAKIDLDRCYVWFKNNCPLTSTLYGNLYDDFRIANLETGDVLYTIIPPQRTHKGEVWGRDNEFKEPLMTGSWKEIKKFFNI